MTDKPLNPKLSAIRDKYKNGIPTRAIDGTAEKIENIYFKWEE